MNIFKRMLRVATVLGAVGTSLALGAGDSHAGLGLQIDFGNNGSFEILIQDSGAGDLSGAIGRILQDYCNPADCSSTALSNTGVSKPILGSVTDPSLDLSTALTSAGAIDIKIQLSDTGFSGDLNGIGQLVSIGGTLTSGAGSYIITNIYRDNTNAQFGTGGLICSTGALFPDGSNFDAFAGGCGNYMNLADPYSVTIETIMHLTAAGDASYDARFRLGSDGEIDVPEPASMMLLGFGVLGIGAWRRRRRAQQD